MTKIFILTANEQKEAKALSAKYKSKLKPIIAKMKKDLSDKDPRIVPAMLECALNEFIS